MVDYLKLNRQYIDAFVQKTHFLQGAAPDGTYLYWLDFSLTGLSPEEISKRLMDAKLALRDGEFFTNNVKNHFFRLNFATSKKRVDFALKQITKAFSDR